ncbi:hypothetical protein ASF22_19550 [Methylobacterium sp. Leaf87]|uniref:hypothetical protein n=1 Tax=Methylobacterium sp. Leaf87 TaxID=1736243 RepID=UPI0006FCC88F|nr:hypothetical protein [Methylobacterium sp. Leaf87]KQO68753.1 hypothetical protein ASF22_19550 [Methylobacterium sp. Leaf87]
MIPKIHSPLLAVAACALLGACSDEPSAAAMQQAMSNVFARMPAAQVAVANMQLGGRSAGRYDALPDISGVRKASCLPAQAKDGHVCEFAVTINGIERPKMKARFFKGTDGNLAMDD